MVASRRRELISNGSSKADPDHTYKHLDLESGSYGHDSHLRKFRFRDVVDATMDQKHLREMKQKLLNSVDHKGLEKFRQNEKELKAIQNKKLRAFYEEQNRRLDDWLEVDMVVTTLADDVLDSMGPRDLDHDGVAEDRGPLHTSEGTVECFLPDEEIEKRRKADRNVRWAININVIVNILLLAAKGIAAIYSSSLSLIASLVDSALDLLCTLIIWSTNKLVGWRLTRLKKKFPVGRRRLEPIGILVFSIIMVVSFIQILQESVQKLLPSGDHTTAELPPMAIFSMVSTIVVKGIIGLGCMRVKTTQVRALAQDCKTDVYFNTLSLLFPLIGNKLDVWWLDPVGATILSLYIIYDWAGTCIENIVKLTGEAADDRTARKMLYMAYRFSPLVGGYKSIKAYHAGDGVWVEVDVLMDEKTPLKEAHDVAETIQYCMEGLKEVDRAFVTMDYTSQGPTGHATENE
ncbi:hypothetical protein BU24DRAFT_435193 [Aaosphaeria arxii CBS 175.79]|uniref:Cation efflux protein transmembrane domain-containing protein n=1 Tax=Aaosphaeria arxii CBS 175.79 TaxID=1450172 RepID=A0A6A5XI98_9PLEO|nr:uncharacterized protein BU24DRAFT_435193 [Aaosphaeria arxii CBS 175.79]KAF2012842.1 hypothetical protein BU24DRAFT_435193 [Aaosphaeria arxii CBS 175.79]